MDHLANNIPFDSPKYEINKLCRRGGAYLGKFFELILEQYLEKNLPVLERISQRYVCSHYFSITGAPLG